MEHEIRITAQPGDVRDDEQRTDRIEDAIDPEVSRGERTTLDPAVELLGDPHVEFANST
jgi:hypothetical protein